jgi:hypothetical protein
MLFFDDSCPSLLNSVLRPRGPFSHAEGHRAYTSRGGCLLIAHTTCCFLPSFGEKWQAGLDAAGRARGDERGVPTSWRGLWPSQDVQKLFQVPSPTSRSHIVHAPSTWSVPGALGGDHHVQYGSPCEPGSSSDLPGPRITLEISRLALLARTVSNPQPAAESSYWSWK